MKRILVFLRDFYRNNGFAVFFSFFLQKVTAFASTLIVVRLLTPEEFGLLSIVPAIFVMFAPFVGLGLPVALLRYGSMLKTEDDKKVFAAQLLRKGMGWQVLLSLLFLGASVFFVPKYEDIFIIFLAFAIRLFGVLFLSHLQVYHRILFDNKTFAKITNFNSILGLLLVILGGYFWGLQGYLLAMAITPYFILLFYNKGMKGIAMRTIFFPKKEVWRFSWHSALTNFSSELLFAIDILLLSYFLSEQSVAEYRVAILIPANMIFLAQSFVQSDYPKLSAKSQDYFYLKNYVTQFYKIFIPITGGIILVGYCLRKEIIELFFGEVYQGVLPMFVVFLLAFGSNMLLRVLYGNLLSAIGKMHWVTGIISLTVAVLVGCSMVLVPHFQTMGMALSMLVALWFCGGSLGLVFFRELKKLKPKK